MSENILHTDHLTMKFGGLTAVNKVSIHVKQGEILGLIGPNGAGKTTLFNMIAGALHPTSGKVMFKDKAVQGLEPHSICKLGIGRTYQIVQPFLSLTVLENVMVGTLLRNPNVSAAQKKGGANSGLCGACAPQGRSGHGS